MINPNCRKCGRELDKPGALYFSPPMKFALPLMGVPGDSIWADSEPDGASGVSKWHLCRECHDLVRKFITGDSE